MKRESGGVYKCISDLILKCNSTNYNYACNCQCFSVKSCRVAYLLKGEDKHTWIQFNNRRAAKDLLVSRLYSNQSMENIWRDCRIRPIGRGLAKTIGNLHLSVGSENGIIINISKGKGREILIWSTEYLIER